MRNTTAAQSTATPAATRRMGSESSVQVAFPFTARAWGQLKHKKVTITIYIIMITMADHNDNATRGEIAEKTKS